MPWVNINDASQVTYDEFNHIVEMIEDGEISLDDAREDGTICIDGRDLFDHTMGEIMKMEDEDRAKGLFTTNILTDE